MNYWLNVYKPVGVSSAAVVGVVKKCFEGRCKVGHAGTLDLEAEGVLPIAVGEATKLIKYLMNSRKTYVFKIQFGASTDTGDRAGSVVARTQYIPTYDEAMNICQGFIGKITQTPPKYSALKISGTPAYKLARMGCEVEMKPRSIEIFSLKCIDFNKAACVATYITEVSKGTYIRSLAEDISLSLQSLGFVLELRRSAVGRFIEAEAVNIYQLAGDMRVKNPSLSYADIFTELLNSTSGSAVESFVQKPEVVLADIPVIDVDVDVATRVHHGQTVYLESEDFNDVWLRLNGNVLAIGSIYNGKFSSARCLNLWQSQSIAAV